VALTAGGFDSEWAQWRAQGMSDWLGKPFDYQKMLTVLSRNLPASDLAQGRA
jgi:CheY-like chemotaxis protein